ncbi:unnamed protein product [Brassica napus]|nr:unnamed protein product [Brassica napus]
MKVKADRDESSPCVATACCARRCSEMQRAWNHCYAREAPCHW